MSTSILHDGHNLRRGLQVVGTCFLLAGAGTAAYLYQSFGVTLPEKLLYAALGVLLAASTALVLPLAIMLWRKDAAMLAVVAAAVWLFALFPLGVQHHAGFFSVSQADLAASGLGAQAARAQLDALEAQTAQYQGASGFDVAGAQAQAARLQADLQAARAALAACPKSHKSNCIQPKTAAIGEIEGRLNAVQAQIASAGQFSRLTSERAQAAQQLAAAASGNSVAAGAVHPLFDTLGRIAGVSPMQAQAAFLGFTALTVELLSALMFVWAGALGGKRDGDGWQVPIPPAQTVPALDAGGRITGEGLAHVHTNETVLNETATRFFDEHYPGLLDEANRLQTATRNNGYPYPTDSPTVKPATIFKTVGEVKPCARCGQPFNPKRSDKLYCGDACRQAAWEARTGRKLKKHKPDQKS